MESGDIVIYTFLDKITKDEIERPAIITSKSSESVPARNLFVFFEVGDNPACGSQCPTWNHRSAVPFGDGAMTWHRKR